MAKKRGKGEGSVFKRKDGRWVAEIVMPDGKARLKYGKTQKAVNDWLLLQRNAVRNNAWVSDDSVTVGEFLDHYLQDVLTPTIRTSTLVSYKGIIDQHLKPAFGEVKLSRLTAPMVQGLYTEKLNSGLSNRRVLYFHAVLHKALDQAVKWDLIPRNVTDMVDPPRIKRDPPKVWTMDQIKAFVEATKDHPYKALYALALGVGLRQGELLGLQIADVDFVSGMLKVNQALEIVRGAGWKLSNPKTARSRRSIRIPSPILEVVRNYVAGQNRSSGFLFVSEAGTPILPRNLVRNFKALLVEAGLPEIRFHDLRHHCATLHLRAGTSLVVVAQILGHSSPTLTMSTYSHILPEVEKEAADRMGGLLTGY